MRTVVVMNYRQPNHPVEYGRATLSPNGSVTLRGFMPARVQTWTTDGIFDWAHNQHVPVTDGNRFLDLLLTEFRGSYMRAVETP